MAEAAPVTISRPLCRYFVHGACREGDGCRFSHNRSDKLDNTCRFYLKGCCMYGDKCRYDHVRPKPITSTCISPTKVECRQKMVPAPVLTRNGSTSGSNMVSLKKVLNGLDSPVTTPVTPKPPEEWVLAKEFVPGIPYECSSVPSSYAKAACSGSANPAVEEPVSDPSQLLCPFSANKECPYGDKCAYIHGDVCDLCGLAVLHPHDKTQQEKHKADCMADHEREMEIAFAVAQSKDKSCGICMDTVMEKEPPTERRFGLLSDCNHCFCLACIRKWRGAKQFDNKIVRSCPECRVQSDFITPSIYWVETKEEKIKVIQGYKEALSKKPCKYFDEGRGECPFNDKCFYKHAYPDGTIAPPQPWKPRRRRNADGDLDLLERIMLWDFLEERENRVQLLLELDDELSFLLDLATDSSDDSDFDDLW